MINTTQEIPCLVCRKPLALRLARGRKSGKISIMLICPTDGRHFRGFISDRTYVGQVLALLEEQPPILGGEGDEDISPTSARRSKTILEPGND